MLEVGAKARGSAASANGPPLDFQQHLASLEAHGLLVRIERAINKDTELHPLVRWQFQGGLAEEQRRAFLFTNVIDGAGRRYDIPVVVGALAASPQIYALGMGRPVADIESAWFMRSPIHCSALVASPRCQEVVIAARLARHGGGLARLPVPISTPGFDAAPYLTATLCVTRDPDTGIQNMGTYRAALKATDRLACAWPRASAAPGATCIGESTGSGASRSLAPSSWAARRSQCYRRDEACDRSRRDGGRRRSCRRADRGAKAVTVDLDVPADAELVIEGLIDAELLEPEGPFGESHGHVALEDYNMSMRVTAITHKRSPVFASIISQVTPSKSSVLKKVAMSRCSSLICASSWESRACVAWCCTSRFRTSARSSSCNMHRARRAPRSGAVCTVPPHCSPIVGRSVSR